MSKGSDMICLGEREREREGGGVHLLSGVQNARQAAECTTGLIIMFVCHYGAREGRLDTH